MVSITLENVYDIGSKNAEISTNGEHVGVLYNGLVHCNVHPYGLPLVAWLNDFLGSGGCTVTPSKYQSLKIQYNI